MNWLAIDGETRRGPRIPKFNEIKPHTKQNDQPERCEEFTTRLSRAHHANVVTSDAFLGHFHALLVWTALLFRNRAKR
jgi:hypothetical protein